MKENAIAEETANGRLAAALKAVSWPSSVADTVEPRAAVHPKIPSYLGTVP